MPPGKSRERKIKEDESDKGDSVFRQLDVLKKPPEQAIVVPVSDLEHYVQQLRKSSERSSDSLGYSLISIGVTALFAAIGIVASVGSWEYIDQDGLVHTYKMPVITIIISLAAGIGCLTSGIHLVRSVPIISALREDLAKEVANNIEREIARHKQQVQATKTAQGQPI